MLICCLNINSCDFSLGPTPSLRHSSTTTEQPTATPVAAATESKSLYTVPYDVTDFGSYWRRGELELIDEDIASKSPSLLALHARLNLDKYSVSLPVLARTLICQSAQSSTVDNLALSSFGKNLLNYYVYEYLMTVYPRLPATILAQTAELYIDTKSLSNIASQWGVEEDTRSVLEKYLEESDEATSARFNKSTNKPELVPGVSGTRSALKNLGKLRYSPSAIKREDGVIELIGGIGEGQRGSAGARATFVRALVSAIYAEGSKSGSSGLGAAREFVHSHIIAPKKLDLSSMLTFEQPTRELSRLCAREGIAAPVSRLLVESGRLTSHPLFVVGVFSGNEKLGEGQGASLVEAKTRAAVMALKSWYLYTPLEADKNLPGMADTEEKAQEFRGARVDKGAVIV